ncbi:hypothetical protein JL721_12809 [Aureococcus anophagefferens]|nr:hypothetical protein JL721_12809 [Aureococcus anophagefferens]
MADPSGAEAEIDGEEKRIRFQAPKKRFAALAAAPRATSQHDTVALVEGEEGYRLALDGDAGGAVDPRRACLLRSELLRLSQLEKRKDFLKLVHEPLWPLAQSLPEVLHNGDRIATVLGAAFADPATRVAGAYSLASVRAGDVLGVVLARGGAVADRVLTLLLDATRPGDDVEPLWAAVVDGAANRASAGDAALGDALARLATVVSWRRARLLTNRDDDLKVDRFAQGFGADRCDRLAALLDGLVAGAGAGAAPRDAGASSGRRSRARPRRRRALRAAAPLARPGSPGVLKAGGARDALAARAAFADAATALAGAAAGPRVAALAAQLVDACSRRAFESEKTAELRVVAPAGLR